MFSSVIDFNLLSLPLAPTSTDASASSLPTVGAEILSDLVPANEIASDMSPSSVVSLGNQNGAADPMNAAYDGLAPAGSDLVQPFGNPLIDSTTLSSEAMTGLLDTLVEFAEMPSANPPAITTAGSDSSSMNTSGATIASVWPEMLYHDSSVETALVDAEIEHNLVDTFAT